MNTPPPVVVFVHGLWMNGFELSWLRRRVRRSGFRVEQFVYPTVRRAVPANADALYRFVRELPAGQLHLVGYSLGGVVTLEMLARYGDRLPPGRVVLIGSPVRGSTAARNLIRHRWSHRLLGGSTSEGLLDDHTEHADGTREVGVIAGTRSIGLGGIWGDLGQPNDGTVAASETRLAIETDRLELPLTHVTLMFSKRVARAVSTFLRQGRFRDDSEPESGARG